MEKALLDESYNEYKRIQSFINNKLALYSTKIIFMTVVTWNDVHSFLSI